MVWTCSFYTNSVPTKSIPVDICELKVSSRLGKWVWESYSLFYANSRLEDIADVKTDCGRLAWFRSFLIFFKSNYLGSNYLCLKTTRFRFFCNLGLWVRNPSAISSTKVGPLSPIRTSSSSFFLHIPSICYSSFFWDFFSKRPATESNATSLRWRFFNIFCVIYLKEVEGRAPFKLSSVNWYNS